MIVESWAVHSAVHAVTIQLCFFAFDMSHEVPPPPSLVSTEHTSANEDQANHSSDQLINVLQSCFSDLLRKQDEIQKAIEALKPPVPVTDKKSTFWTSYMKLADEHDKEFKEKYSTDLDTSLIFAGLFSAIGSAFIIQIQPQLTPGPHAKPPIKIVVAQSLLYISLSTTLLAALLAVLGKQWIMYYQAAGSRGTIEQRGLERQRKLDGLRKWKFDTLLQMFPLLLQLGLLLFSTALSIYLWTVNVSIAIIVLAFTLLGVGAYLYLLSSAIFSPDSPFQTPLAPFLKHTISITLKMLKPPSRVINLWCNVIQHVKAFMSEFRKSEASLLPCFAAPTSMSSNTPLEEEFPEIVFDKPSAEVSAVLWVLETSTDPLMISTAAEMAIDLQWPVDLDLTLSMNRLDETVKQSLQSKQNIPATSCGMAYCSLRLVARAGRASGFYSDPLTGWPIRMEHPAGLQNVKQICNEYPSVIIDSATWQVTKWALYNIPSLYFHGESYQLIVEYFLNQFPPQNMPTLDEEDVCNYLCCLNSFFGPCDPRIMIQKSKKPFKVFLMTQLFKNLQTARIDAALSARLIKFTSELLNMAHICENQYHSTRQVGNLITEISQFCSTVPQEEGWLDLVVSAAMLASARNTGFHYAGQQLQEGKLPNVQWIYTALEHLHNAWCALQLEEWDTTTNTAVDGLLVLLAWNSPASLSHTPSEACLKPIIQALSTHSGSSAQSAFYILTEARSWYLVPQLQSILHKLTVWTHLGSFAFQNASRPHVFQAQYFELGKYIATIPEWKPELYNNLGVWISVFNSVLLWHDELSTSCSFVFRNIWVSDGHDRYQFLDKYEPNWALAVTALAQAWETFEFSDLPSLHDFVRLFRGTVSVALRVEYWDSETRAASVWKDISPDLREKFSPELGKSLIQAAQNALDNRQQAPGSLIAVSSEDILIRVAGLLSALGQEIGTKFESGSGEVQLGGMTTKYNDWDSLRNAIHHEIISIDASLLVY
ncbi:hypothetical protein GGX14DRAFT_624925 [Mycena pura]|uniref:DUF6535 domain-containing protein n=1 Tax=Mycena pura TaxID=153505 RepID=A0AAD6YFN1_9AGAR|nr:hypothetical protein GGX14DRAFT_624925 [Mycena pura]